MNDGRLEIREIFSILARHRKLILQTIGLALVLAIAVNLFMPKKYESNVNVRVKYNRGLNDKMGTLSQEEVMNQQIYTYAEIIKGKTVVEGMLAKVFADKATEDKPNYEQMSKRIEAKPLKNTEILNITVQGNSPEEAQLLAQVLVDTFLAKITDMVRLEGKEVRVFIGQRMQEAKEKLDEIEKEIAIYKENNKIYSVVDQTTNLMNRQQDLKKRQIDIEMAIEEGQSKLATTSQQIGRESEGFIGDSLVVQQYKNKLVEMETGLIDLRKSYTDNHPKVQASKASIAATRERLNTEIAKIAKGESPSSNPVHQQLLQAELSGEVDWQIAQAQKTAISQAIIDIEHELANLPTREQGLAKLLRDQAVAEAAYTEFAQNYEQARVDEVKQPTNIQIVDLPDKPSRPCSPRTLLNITIALIGGLFSGIVLAFSTEFFFKTIDSTEDVHRYLGVTIIGEVISTSNAEPKGIRQKLSQYFNTNEEIWKTCHLIKDREQSALAESFRSLRTSLQTIQEKDGVRSILITGCCPKSTAKQALINVGAALAYAGKKIIIIDADFSSPSFHTYFPISNIGITNVLVEECQLDEAIHPSGIANLAVLPSGTRLQNPLAMLTAKTLRTCLEKLEDQFDFVLVNSPEILINVAKIQSDACILASKVQGTILFIDSRQVGTQAARRAVELIRGTRSNLFGVILGNMAMDEIMLYPGLTVNSQTIRG